MIEPLIPTYGRACVSDLMPNLLGPGSSSGQSLPVPLPAVDNRVFLVLDGLGWDQLEDRRHLTPVLDRFDGGPITTVAPTTTATALTSITTGLTPGEHGVVGYRMVVDDEVLNTLRWGTPMRPDARTTSPPDLLQPYDPFLGQSVALVTKAEFRRSGFTLAHLRGARLTGYRTVALLVHETARLVKEGEPFVYAYYDGVDKVAHEYGLGDAYDAELSFVDRLVGDLVEALPAGTQIVITADHGQVDCRDGLRPISDDVLALTARLSGEGRFRWLHAADGAASDLLGAATEAHGEQAWVRSIDQMLDEHWFGPTAAPVVRDRLGDVALMPFEPIAYEDPDDTGPFDLIARHGSLTSAEVLVPLLSSFV